MYVFYGSDIFTFFKEKIHTQKINKRKCISIIFPHSYHNPNLYAFLHAWNLKM